MSWADGDAVMSRVERLVNRLYNYRALIATPNGEKLRSPKAQIPRMTYEIAMRDHGCDKPDLRNRHLVSWL